MFLRYPRAIPPVLSGFCIRLLSATASPYAGHNKVCVLGSPVSANPIYMRLLQWSKIQQKKGINDQRRGQIYARAFRVSMFTLRFFFHPQINTCVCRTS
jgi:hypothetical protein